MSRISESEILKAVELFNSGMSITKIAKLLNRDRVTLTGHLKKYGLNITQHNNKKNVNSNYFKNINEQSAYWLGLLMADGHIDLNNNILELCLKDKEHVEAFKRHLNSDHKISIRVINGKEYYRLSLRDKEIVKDLAYYGFYNTKTYYWEIPNIPQEFMKDFVRGLFDGDGCFKLDIRNKIYVGASCYSIVSYSEEVLNQLKVIISDNANIDPQHICIQKSKNRIPDLRIFSKDAIQKFADWIYTDATIYLERKHNKYLEFCRLRAISEKN